MRFRHGLFLVSSFLLIIFSWYYVVCFCGIYDQNSTSWILNGVISLLIDNCVVQIIVPLIVSIIRYIATFYGFLV